MPAAVPPVTGADHDREVTPPTPGGAWARVSDPASPGAAQTLAFPGAQSHPLLTPSPSASATTHAPAWHSPQLAQGPPSPMTVTSVGEGSEEQPPIETVTE